MKESDFDRIKNTLDHHHNWPSVYMFKFIVPSDNETVAKLEAMFNTDTAEIKSKQSAKGNYVSLTVREVMTDANEVMECYRKASKIDGLIAL